MTFAVYGAGAIGGFVAARLAAAGHEVSVIARGPHLAAIQRDGLRLNSFEFGETVHRLQAVEDPADIGPVDYVVLGVKAQALTAIAPRAAALLGPETAVVTTQNGLPYWYFHGSLGGGEPLQSIDPGGVIVQHLPPERAIGSIAYVSCSVPEPGVIDHTQGNRFPLGEPSGQRTERIRALSDALRAGGVKAPIRNDIRHELWVKLLGNAVFNPLSALTRKTMVEMVEYPLTYRLMSDCMTEVRETAAASGAQIAFSNEQRLEGGRSAGFHKTSMLQDLESGRSPELDPILGAVIELADRLNVPTPGLRAIYAATCLLFEQAREPEAPGG